MTDDDDDDHDDDDGDGDDDDDDDDDEQDRDDDDHHRHDHDDVKALLHVQGLIIVPTKNTSLPVDELDSLIAHECLRLYNAELLHDLRCILQSLASLNCIY